MHSIKKYSQILEKLVENISSEKELKENIKAFLEFVASNNNTHLLKKIFEVFEKQYCKKENIEKAYIEFGEASSKNEDFTNALKNLFQKGQKNLIVTSKVNPDLISGVRINYNDSYLIEASFGRMVGNLFR